MRHIQSKYALVAGLLLVVVFAFFAWAQLILPRIYVSAQAIFLQGDANNDGRVNLVDYEVWRTKYMSGSVDPTTGPTVAPTIQPTIADDAPRVSTVAQGLRVPWALAFLPNGDLMFTERPGRVRIVKNNVLQQEPVGELANVAAIGEGGLLGMALHPAFASNRYVYFYYTYSVVGDATKNRLVRMKYENDALGAETVLIDAIPGANIHNGGRIKFGPDGFLYIGTGDAAEPSLAQDTGSLAGKILRVTDGGAAAPGNPFSNRTYSYGHRNPQGLAWDSAGQLWASEHGPDGQDELNVIDAGANYGWPTIRGNQQQEGMVKPVAHSGTDTWAPSGMSIIGSKVYLASLRGAAVTVMSLPNGTNLTQYFKDEYGRLRDVVIGPDGMMYVSTSNTNEDKILRINPNKL